MHGQVCQAMRVFCCEIEVSLMPANSRSSSETVKDALLWGVGVVAPILLMLILLWWVVR